MDVFVENESLAALLNIDNQKSVVIGRTGSGKSALLQYIELTEERVSRIDPEAMSMRFLANSTILNYFRTIGLNLNFFYKVLWKHVLIIELLKFHVGEDELKRVNWIENIKSKLFSKSKKNPRKERAIEYLSKWGREFWLDTETRIKEIEQKVESKFLESIGLTKQSFQLGIQNENLIGEIVRTEYRQKAEAVINESHAEDLIEIVSILRGDIFNESGKRYYVIIDDLDKEWISTNVRYDLITALIEVVKEFQIFNGVKIIIALRDNLHQILFSGVKHNGGQREKFKPLYLNLTWSTEELRLLIDRRLASISENQLSIQSAFEKIYNKQIDGFEYVLERTFLRPRDVISYINHMLEKVESKSSFSLDLIQKAEINYSFDRLQAIEDEWGENYGNLKDIYSFLIGKYNGFKIRNLKEDEFFEFLLNDSPEQSYRGDLLTIHERSKSGMKFSNVAKEIIFLLYQIGIVGIKKGPTYPVTFYYQSDTLLTVNDLNQDAKIYVHKAFYSVLKINTKELEPDF